MTEGPSQLSDETALIGWAAVVRYGEGQTKFVGLLNGCHLVLKVESDASAEK